MARIDPNSLELAEVVVQNSVRRVSHVRTGGRNFSFTAMVVAGDRNGHVGLGSGKAGEVAEAIRKATEAAKKNIIDVPVVDGTIPHEIIGRFGAARVLLKPAAPGTGIIASGGIRIILDLAGVRDILTKSLGSGNPQNSIKATVEGLQEWRNAEVVAAERGLELRDEVADHTEAQCHRTQRPPAGHHPGPGHPASPPAGGAQRYAATPRDDRHGLPPHRGG